MAEEDSEVSPGKVRSKRIFLNHLDSCVGSHTGKYLSNCVVGASLEAPLEEEQIEEESDSVQSIPVAKGTYKVVGTQRNPDAQKPDFAFEIFSFNSREQLLEYLLDCDIIIYNITETTEQIDEASWAVSALHSEIGNFESSKTFILLSTIMTWGQTKTTDPEDMLTEDEYRRRKAHPNFKDHLSLEKLVIKLGKTKRRFTTFVVASGLVYGMEESVFHYFFKEAWLGLNPAIPCFGAGKNVVPTIHVKDLAGVIQNIIERKPKTNYILAMDDSKHKMKEIVKAISKLGPGKVQHVPEADALLNYDLTQSDLDHLMVNLTMEAFFIKENFNIHWVAENGIVENIQNLFKEFKQSRVLLPLKIAILGPPAVGKTSIAEKLAKHYKLHHIKIKDVIEEAIANLELKSTQPEIEEAEEAEEEGDDTGVKDAQDLLDQVRDNMEQNGEYIFSLEASNEFLKNRALNLPESLVVGTHYTQDKFMRHLAQYREQNTEDETLLNYFDEIEIHPVHIDVSQDNDAENTPVIDDIIKIVGSAKNYGPTPEELKELQRRQADERLAREAAEIAERERREAEEAAEKMARWEEWSKRLEEVKRQEQEFLEAHSVPLRNYLMQNVMPTLTKGLIECCKIRPSDPVDFLAEYLFKHNPQVE
ncbi:adenylate kinase 7 isoform X4 [Hemiscyllium ocellatum]|uniref:adenylate kinase 7 isoform X4 n=1 Tax=Hemiscyllium ocellatum TaxID=170820 RepID=UPI002966358D|nr:adenylate kinase 7 isoform X4 [Hemiscyllium ocellatum]